VTRALAAAATLLAVVALAPPARAQDLLDQGIFLITRDGAEIGREEFAIQATPGSQGRPGVRAVATDRYREREVRAALELTGDHAPLAYQVDVTVAGRLSERLSLQAGRGRFALRIVTSSGEVAREFPAPPGAVVLDDDGFDQFYFVPRPSGDGAVAVNLVRPREKRVVPGEVRADGADTVVVGGRPTPALKFVLTIAGGAGGAGTREFWFTPSGSLLRIAVPSTAVTATRASLPQR